MATMTNCRLEKNQRERGIAVVLTITVVALLMVTALELNRRAMAAMDSASLTGQRMTLSYMASSGIHAAMALLSKDKKESGEVDSLQEIWADPEKISELLGELPFEEGSVEVVIHDELGRIQVNALVEFPQGQSFNSAQQEMWNRFIGYIRPLEGLDDEDTSSAAITDSIKDWIDSGDDDMVSGVLGAESTYYEDLDPSYSCANMPMGNLNELLLVKGVAKLAESLGGLDTVMTYLTVYGMQKNPQTNKFYFPGAININTAELAVIAAMIDQQTKADQAGSIIEFREEKSEDQFVHQDLAGKTWYKTVPGVDATINEALITTQSDFFRIEAVAQLNNMKLKQTQVVQRVQDDESKKWTCQVLSWETE